MEMVRTVCLTLVLAASAWGAEFSLAIGNPVAVALPEGVVKKDVGFGVRAENCADPAKAQITGSAEGMVDGSRRSIPVRVVAGATPGAFAVSRDWPQQGTWVVNLTAHCGGSTASAIVPIGPNGYVRETTKFFPRAATAAEVESGLKSLTGGAR
jgi:hypothetical protein